MNKTIVLFMIWAYCTLPVSAQMSQKVFCNQAGYNLNEAKFFTCPNCLDGKDFNILDNKGKIVFTGKIAKQQGNFTAFNPTASQVEYVIDVKGIGRSVPFWVADHIMESMPDRRLKQDAQSNVSQQKKAENDYNFNAMLQPVPLLSKFTDPGYYVWDRTMVKGDDGKYHMFYSRWPLEYGFNAWVTHSEVVHTVGDSPIGPFVFKNVALPARGNEFWDGMCTHNPTILKFGKKYYIYYTGR
jgi:hypothetical protein